MWRHAHHHCISHWHHAAQFGGQEPGSDQEIAEFCEKNHGVSFPLMKKSEVNGDNTNEVFKYLKSQKAGLLGLTPIKACLRPYPKWEVC